MQGREIERRHDAPGPTLWMRLPNADMVPVLLTGPVVFPTAPLPSTDAFVAGAAGTTVPAGRTFRA